MSPVVRQLIVTLAALTLVARQATAQQPDQAPESDTAQPEPAAVSAASQPQPSSPDPNATFRPMFQMTWAVTAGRDDNVLAESGASGDPRSSLASPWESADAAIRGLTRWRRVLVTVTATGTGRTYGEVPALSAVDGRGGIAVVVPIGRRTTAAIFQGAQYRPYYGFTIPGAAPVDPEVGLELADMLTRHSSVSYDQQYGVTHETRKLSFGGQYSRRRDALSGAVEPFRWSQADVVFRRKFTRRASLRLGYGYGEARDGLHVDAPVAITHNIDVGVDYVRPLTRSGRTTFTFGSGTTVLSYQGGRHVRLLVDAVLARQLTRTWTMNVEYHRGVSFVEGFSGPVYADTVRVSDGGNITRRLAARLYSSYVTGQFGVSPLRTYVTLSGGAELSWKLTRRLGISGKYEGYGYRFDRAADVPFGLSHVHRRQSLRISFTGSL